MADNNYCPGFNILLICSGLQNMNSPMIQQQREKVSRLSTKFILPMSTSSCTFSELRNTAASPHVDLSPLQVPLDLTIPGITEVCMHLPILHIVSMPPLFGRSICTHSSIQEVGKAFGMRTCHCYAYNSWFYLHYKAYQKKLSHVSS